MRSLYVGYHIFRTVLNSRHEKGSTISMSNSKFSSVSILLATFFTAGLSAAHASEKLCLSDVCIGDEMSDLTHVDWSPAKTKISGILAAEFTPRESVVKDLLKGVAPSIRKEVESLAGYFVAGKIDSGAVERLGALKGFCELFKPFGVIHGSFMSKSGHITTVDFKLLVGEQPEDQKIIVDKIERTFKGVLTEEQRNDLFAQTSAKYNGFKQTKPSSYSAGDPLEQAWEFTGKSLTLYGPRLLPISWQVGFGGNDKLLKYPGCSGSNAVSLD